MGGARKGVANLQGVIQTSRSFLPSTGGRCGITRVWPASSA